MIIAPVAGQLMKCCNVGTEVNGGSPKRATSGSSNLVLELFLADDPKT